MYSCKSAHGCVLWGQEKDNVWGKCFSASVWLRKPVAVWKKGIRRTDQQTSYPMIPVLVNWGEIITPGLAHTLFRCTLYGIDFPLTISFVLVNLFCFWGCHSSEWLRRKRIDDAASLPSSMHIHFLCLIYSWMQQDLFPRGTVVERERIVFLLVRFNLKAICKTFWAACSCYCGGCLGTSLSSLENRTTR